MPEISNPQEVSYSASLLDRLCVDSAAEQTACPLEVSWHAHLSAIQRDLQALLGTCCHLSTQARRRFPELEGTVLDYGLVDFMGVGSPEQTCVLLSASLRRLIEQFEPRLLQPRVIAQPFEAGASVARFRVEALVMADPAPRVVAFDTLVDLDRADCSVGALR